MSTSTNGIKAAEIIRLGPCAVCGKKLCETGEIMFYRLQIERALLELSALRRAAGLEMIIGPLASTMGPDEDLARVIEGPVTVVVHEQCAHGTMSLLSMMGLEDGP